MNFLFYDIIFLVLFAIFVSLFLYKNRSKLKREGLLFLYKESWGIKLINTVGKKYNKILGILSYISIIIGYVLMVSMFYLLGRIVYLYISFPAVVKEIKIPPITPLVPYLPQIFKLDFLPPFYFTYWIVIIAIIAISHEFSHGIFAAYNKIRIKSTGFGFFPFFLPIFLAAFVELDEKRMMKKKISSQLAILSAGTFANVITAIIFFGVIWIFFPLAFSPAGIIYDSYPYNVIGLSAIVSVNGINLESASYENALSLMKEEGLNKIKTNDGMQYVVAKNSFEEQKDNAGFVLYYDAPAVNSNLERVITKINGEIITNVEEIESELSKYSPGEKITLTVLDNDGTDYNRDIVLGENPANKKAWLGIGFYSQKKAGLVSDFYSAMSSFKKPNTYYQPRFDGFSVFIYNLLWWLALISISVALINMLPVGIFDGGRFFYLTILALTKSEQKARKLFSLSTYTILFIILILMVYWFMSVF